MCFMWSISYFTTCPFRSCSKHLERLSRNLKAALSIYFALGFNTACHEPTRQTPAKLFPGLDLLDPLALRWKVTEVLVEPTGPSLPELLEKALNNLRRARRNVARMYSVGRPPNPFKSGDQVLVKINPLSSAVNQTSAKLMLRLSEPLVIVEFLSPVNPVTGLPMRMSHISQLTRKI
jgi:hypothetical protein